MLFKENVAVWWIIRNTYTHTHTHTHTVLAKYNALKRSRGGSKLSLCFKGMTTVHLLTYLHLSPLICHSFTLDSRVSFQNGKISIILEDASSKITSPNFRMKWNFHPNMWAGTLVTLTLERGGGVPYTSVSRQANMSLTCYLLPCTYSESNINSWSCFFPLPSHDKWVPLTKAWRVLRLRMEERPPIWRVAVNILNKQSRTANKGWSSSLGIGRGADNSSP